MTFDQFVNFVLRQYLQSFKDACFEFSGQGSSYCFPAFGWQ